MNKKIKGTIQREYNNIKFKSTLEMRCYQLLEKENFTFSYESEKFILFPAFSLQQLKLIAPKKTNGKYSKFLQDLSKYTIRQITYTPDFKIVKGNNVIYVDVKGKENDVYPYKKKWFLALLDAKNDGNKYYFIEPHSVFMIKEMINYIKQL